MLSKWNAGQREQQERRQTSVPYFGFWLSMRNCGLIGQSSLQSPAIREQTSTESLVVKFQPPRSLLPYQELDSKQDLAFVSLRSS